MPHLTIFYTPQLDGEADMPALCGRLAQTLCGLKDEAGAAVFPTGGVRVLAYPAAHAAVSDQGQAHRRAGGRGDLAFAYLLLRIARGRGKAVHQQVGEALLEEARSFFAPLLERRPLGLTLQIDEGQEVFDAKFGNLHALFQRP